MTRWPDPAGLIKWLSSAKAESQQAQAQSCEEKASGTVVKWGVAGSVVAAGGGITDFLEVLGISVAPEWFGLFF